MEALDRLLHTPDSTNIDDPQALVPITPEEVQLAKETDPFCTGIWERLSRNDGVPINTNFDTGLVFRTKTGEQQLLVPASLQDRVLMLSHYGKLSGHPGDRSLYQSLRSSFYWQSMAPDCYAVAKNFAPCSSNRVLLRINQNPMQPFPAAAPLEVFTIDLLRSCEELTDVTASF